METGALMKQRTHCNDVSRRGTNQASSMRRSRSLSNSARCSSSVSLRGLIDPSRDFLLGPNVRTSGFSLSLGNTMWKALRVVSGAAFDSRTDAVPRRGSSLGRSGDLVLQASD
jgi:hypothetical protein